MRGANWKEPKYPLLMERAKDLAVEIMAPTPQTMEQLIENGRRVTQLIYKNLEEFQESMTKHSCEKSGCVLVANEVGGTIHSCYCTGCFPKESALARAAGEAILNANWDATGEYPNGDRGSDVIIPAFFIKNLREALDKCQQAWRKEKKG